MVRRDRQVAQAKGRTIVCLQAEIRGLAGRPGFKRLALYTVRS
jgi:hypothetical protein